MTSPCAYFIADIHAGIRQDPAEAQKLQDFRTLLVQIAAEGASLYILGDFFDFWFEWKQVIPKRHFGWLRALAELRESGVPVHLFPGNHDFRLRGFLEEQLDLCVHDELDRLRISATNFVIHHGDGLDPRERSYLLLKKIIRHPLSARLFRLLHPDLGMAMADRSGSRDRSHQWEEGFTRKYLLHAMDKLMEAEDDLLLMGHAHRFVEVSQKQRRAFVLPPFQHPARGWLKWDQGQLSLNWQRPELWPGESNRILYTNSTVAEAGS